MANFKVPSDYKEDSGNYSPLPRGDYQVAIEKCNYGLSQNGNTRYKLQLAVMDSKRKLFDNIMLDNGFLMQYPFALTKLMSFLKATGLVETINPDAEINIPENGDQFIGKVVWVTIDIDKRDEGKNTVFTYHREQPVRGKNTSAPAATEFDKAIEKQPNDPTKPF